MLLGRADSVAMVQDSTDEGRVTEVRKTLMKVLVPRDQVKQQDI